MNDIPIPYETNVRYLCFLMTLKDDIAMMNQLRTFYTRTNTVFAIIIIALLGGLSCL